MQGDFNQTQSEYTLYITVLKKNLGSHGFWDMANFRLAINTDFAC